MSSLSFINDWCISLTAIPEYKKFSGKFYQPLDYHILEMMSESNHPKITSEMKQEIKTKLLPNISKATGILPTKLHQTYGLGRFYGDENKTIIPMSKYIKHTVFEYLGWSDIDMVKGHMSIAYEMGRRSNLHFQAIKHYIDNFDEVCDEMREFYQLDSKNALTNNDIKWLFCLMMYGGGLDCWANRLENGDPEKGYSPKKIRNRKLYHPFAQAYKNETKNIIDRIYSTNKTLVRKLRVEGEEPYDTKRRVAHYWFAIIENHIIYLVYELLCDMKIIKPNYCAPEMDGICMPPSIPFNKEDVIQKVNSHILQETGLSIRMKFKEYVDPIKHKDFVLTEFIEQRKAFIPEEIPPTNTEEVVEEVVNDENANNDSEYVKWKTDFEKEWCKIKNTGMFIRKFELFGKTKLVFQNKSTLITSFEHECYYKTENKRQKRVPFILEWLVDSTMRCYDAVECMPPPLVCPKNIFNLWIPSPFESQPITKDDKDFNLGAVQAFASHIETLCNHDKITYDYVSSWIAHSIQKPAEKIGVALTLISDEGVGKNIFTNTLVELYGGISKKAESSQPERDIWGPFNEMLVDSYLIILNETDKRNTFGSEGKIKALITDETLPISIKGRTGFTMNSYHRVIQNTNNEDPVNTHKGDRRNVIIRCSDENKGNSQYFIDLVDKLKEPNALRSIYWCFKTTDIKDFRIGQKIITEYHSEIVKHNMNPLELFMRWFVENHTGIVKVSSQELLVKFNEWRHAGGYTFGEKMNEMSLIKKISLTLKIPKEYMEVKKTKTNNYRLFDTDRIAEFLKIEYTEDTEMVEETDGESVEIEEDN